MIIDDDDDKSLAEFFHSIYKIHLELEKPANE